MNDHKTTICPEKIESSRYKEMTKVDIGDLEALRRCNVPEAVRNNLEIFAGLSANFYDNFRLAVVSPFTGKPVFPVKHFGIDSDPWMHAILFRDASQLFIVICKGLTQNSVLGAILIPVTKTILENRDSWYYSYILKKKIGRNIPRIISYFNSFLAQEVPVQSGPKELVAAIGNSRVGDFVMQLNWLVHILEQQPESDFSVSKILVNGRSDFFDLSEFFKERQSMVLRLGSLGHIEYYARGAEHTLVSGAISFSQKAATSRLKRKFNEFVNRSTGEFRNSVVPLEFDKCALRLWVSFELEKRVWANQIAELGVIVDALAQKCLRKGETLALVFNGMTGIEQGNSPWYIRRLIAREQRLLDEFSARLRCDHKIFNLAGRTLRVKTLFASEVDFVVAPIGSASLIPSLIFDKPGVVYGTNSSEMRSFIGPNTLVLDEQYVTDLHELEGVVNWKTSQCVSYSIAGRDIVKFIEQNFSFGTCPETGRPLVKRSPIASSSCSNCAEVLYAD